MDVCHWKPGGLHCLLFATLVLPIVVACLFARYCSISIHLKIRNGSTTKGRGPKHCRDQYVVAPKEHGVTDTSRDGELTAVLSSSRLTYHELHNVEQFPHGVDKALVFLRTVIPLATRQAQLCQSEPNILTIKEYDYQALARFVTQWDNRIQDQWQIYLQGRKLHKRPRQLFENVSDATDWLKQISPSKLVDGVWLTHVSIATANSSLREVQRSLWQTLSEEYGDGQLARNHVYLFLKLLRSQIPTFPDPDHIQYTDPALEIDSLGSWTSALSQLAISYAMNELDFFPELLGFNLHFELVTLETLQAMYELRELGLDPSYFALHVAIDNPDTGHTAMALHTVTHFMDLASKSMSPAESDKLWSRIQAGFCLSHFASSLPASELAPVHAQLMSMGPRCPDGTHVTPQVVDLIRRKSLVSAKIHCGSRVRLKGRPLIEWMDPKLIMQDHEAQNFVDALASTKPWVYRGDSKRSLFVREISWGGRMFGSFTEKEVGLLIRWIDSMNSCDVPSESRNLLPNLCDDLGQSDTALAPQRTESPLLSSSSSPSSKPFTPPYSRINALSISSSPHIEDLLALWIVTPCLLEGFLHVPSKAATQFGSHIVTILSTQYGFTDAQLSVTGMDGTWRDQSDTPSLEDIVWQIITPDNLSLSNIDSRCSRDRHTWLSQFSFASQIISLAAKPWTNVARLLGMAQEVAELHKAFAADTPCLLPSIQHRYRLGQIAAVEETHVARCIALMCHDVDGGHGTSMMPDLVRGRDLVRQEVERIFS